MPIEPSVSSTILAPCSFDDLSASFCAIVAPIAANAVAPITPNAIPAVEPPANIPAPVPPALEPANAPIPLPITPPITLAPIQAVIPPTIPSIITLPIFHNLSPTEAFISPIQVVAFSNQVDHFCEVVLKSSAFFTWLSYILSSSSWVLLDVLSNDFVTSPSLDALTILKFCVPQAP